MKSWIVLLTISFLSLFLIQETQKNITLALPTPEFDPHPALAIFENVPITQPVNAMVNIDIPPVLGDTSAEKRIYVDLTNQRLYAYQGETLIYNFLVSTGKWGKTPTGAFRIWGKDKYAKMSGGSTLLHTYYFLPNVPYIMWFSNDEVSASRGFSLHGTYWHDNFGHPMSHGCVNMKTEEAALIYNWSDPPIQNTKNARSSKDNPGTLIVIYGHTPQS